MAKILSDAPQPFKGTEVHTLQNGLKIILKSDSTVPVAALQVWARCGAIDESPRIYGISHGLEHMVFKGTPTRSAGEITREIERQGGSMNAATQLETTHYYIDIPAYGLKPAIDVLADTILHPTFPQNELERERLVILEEIHRRDDSPEATLWDEFTSHLFKGTPYGIKVIGSKETVSALSQEDLHNYYRSFYMPSNLTFVVVGDFNKRAVLKQIESLFSKVKPETAPLPPQIAESTNGGPSEKKIQKPVQLSYFAMGTATIGLGHPDAVALDVLSDALAGGTSARLYQRMREETQQVFAISCDFIPFQQRGLFAFFGESLPEKEESSVTELKEQIDNLKNEPISKDELKRAKARIKSDWLHGSETPHGQASTLGSLASLGHLNLIDSYLKQVDKMTTDDLMEAYEKYVAPMPFHITRVSPDNQPL